MDWRQEFPTLAIIASTASALGPVFLSAYRHWSQTGRFDRFRTLVTGRVMAHLQRFRLALIQGKEILKVVRLSDIALATLIDVGFNSREASSLVAIAVQDTRGRFSGLLHKLHESMVNDAFEDQQVEFVELISRFFEADQARREKR